MTDWMNKSKIYTNGYKAPTKEGPQEAEQMAKTDPHAQENADALATDDGMSMAAGLLEED